MTSAIPGQYGQIFDELEPIIEETAVASNGSGCFFGFLLPPLAVLTVGGILTLLSFHSNVQALAHYRNQATDLSFSSTIALDTINQIPDPVDINGHASKISPIFRPEIQYWSESIYRWATEFAMDPNLVAVVMQIESCGDPHAVSRSGAMGLFQVMPFHFSSSDLPFDPETNAAHGLAYLARSFENAKGNTRLALAGYNGGIGMITHPESNWSEQTRRYVYYGASIYQEAVSGMASSPALDEWYRKYGVGICLQAGMRLGLK